MFLTIFTPAYNRAHLLPRLFESLKRQTCTDFEWLIVDDGSTDNTEETVRNFMSEQTPFPIRYYRQANGGKHRAFNYGVSLAKGEWFKCLDSDDWLIDNGVEQIKPYCIELSANEDYCSVTALRTRYPDQTAIGSICNYDTMDSDFVSYRYVHEVVGDRAEIIKTKVWREFPFPEFEGEKFLAEGGTMALMARRYKTRYVNVAFQYCEYQEGGLTDAMRSNEIFMRNPLGTLFNYYHILNFPTIPWRKKLYLLHKYSEYQYITPHIPGELKPTWKMRVGQSVLPAYRLYLSLKRRWTNAGRK